MQFSLSLTVSQNLPKFMSIELVMLSNSLHLESSPQKNGINETYLQNRNRVTDAKRKHRSGVGLADREVRCELNREAKLQRSETVKARRTGISGGYSGRTHSEPRSFLKGHPLPPGLQGLDSCASSASPALTGRVVAQQLPDSSRSHTHGSWQGLQPLPQHLNRGQSQAETWRWKGSWGPGAAHFPAWGFMVPLVQQ